ncbi:MAG: hypothetical protein B6D71_02540 [gamma proteobacterium symbiont of Stewartia floridana]|nr:MAG: hypothetical protein B6D71_02540 [gamma proteobacterium symbiont of Stewartia floridana]
MLEMAYGYCHIVNHCISSKQSKKSAQRLGQAIYNANKYFTLEYLLACEDFDCRCVSPYQHLSRLMTYAWEQNLHLLEMEDHDQSESHQATISHQYNRFLLLLLLDPCHLQEGEPRICFDYLNDLAGEANIIAPDKDEDAAGRYVIDRLGEVPPYLYHPDCLENLPLPRFTLFDLSPVSKTLHQQLRLMEKSEQSKPACMNRLTAKEANNLLARMLKSWHIRLKRDSERHNTSGQIMVWIGVQNAYQYLAGQSTNQEPGDEEITMTQPVGMRDSAHRVGNKRIIALRSNQSRSGVALRIPRQAVSKELIGQLILISTHENKQGSDWKLGVVKRAMNCGDNLLEVGVQFVAGKLEPITLRLAKLQNEEESNPDHGGIFIDQGHNNRSSLIVPKHFFVIGQEYRVEEMIPSPSISPLQQLETTAHFERFRIKSV